MSTLLATAPETLQQALDSVGLNFDLDGNLFKLGKPNRMGEQRKNMKTFAQVAQSQEGGYTAQEFAKLYIQEFPIPVKFAFGDDIHDVFEDHRPGSCMRSSRLRELREVYADNPDQVCVAYSLKDDHPMLDSDVSALLWIGNKRNYLDRIYSNGFATSNGKAIWADSVFDRFDKSTHEVHTLYKHEGSKCPYFTKVITWTLDHPSHRLLPYADTFNQVKSYDDDTVKLTNGSGDFAQLDETEGVYPSSETGVRCDYCGCNAGDDYSSIGDQTVCDDCRSDHYTWCEYYEEEYLNDDVSYVSVYWPRRFGSDRNELSISDEALRSEFTCCQSGEYCIDSDVIETMEGHKIAPDEIDDYVYLEYCGEYAHSDNVVPTDRDDNPFLFRDDAIELHDGQYALEDDAIELHDGQYALEDDAIELHDGQYALEDDAIELHDGQYALEDDAIELHDGQYALEDDAIELHDGQYAVPAMGRVVRYEPPTSIACIDKTPKRIKEDWKPVLVYASKSTISYNRNNFVSGLPIHTYFPVSSSFEVRLAGFTFAKAKTPPTTKECIAEIMRFILEVWNYLDDDTKQNFYTQEFEKTREACHLAMLKFEHNFTPV